MHAFDGGPGVQLRGEIPTAGQADKRACHPAAYAVRCCCHAAPGATALLHSVSLTPANVRGAETYKRIVKQVSKSAVVLVKVHRPVRSLT